MVDAAARLPGRGAWLHPSRECATIAVQRKAFGRALRAGVLDATGLREELGVDIHQPEG